MPREVKKSNIVQLVEDILIGNNNSQTIIQLIEFLCSHAPSALFVDESTEGLEAFQSLQEFLDEYSPSE